LDQGIGQDAVTGRVLPYRAFGRSGRTQ
jgi:hypothetical protein